MAMHNQFKYYSGCTVRNYSIKVQINKIEDAVVPSEEPEMSISPNRKVKVPETLLEKDLLTMQEIEYCGPAQDHVTYEKLEKLSFLQDQVQKDKSITSFKNEKREWLS